MKDIKNKHLFIVLIVICILLIYIPYVSTRFEASRMYTNPLYRCLEFIIGFIIAKISSKVDLIRNLYWYHCVNTLFLVVLVLGITFKGYYVQEMIVVPCFMGMIFCLGKAKFSKTFNSPVIIYLSKVSYAFFLGQFFVWNPIKFLKQYTGQLQNFTQISVSFIGCCMVAVILHELVEKKISNYLKNKIST